MPLRRSKICRFHVRGSIYNSQPLVRGSIYMTDQPAVHMRRCWWCGDPLSPKTDVFLIQMGCWSKQNVEFVWLLMMDRKMKNMGVCEFPSLSRRQYFWMCFKGIGIFFNFSGILLKNWYLQVFIVFKEPIDLADFPAVFFHISHWYLSWNTNWQLTTDKSKS